jgi:hypothetical protein
MKATPINIVHVWVCGGYIASLVMVILWIIYRLLFRPEPREGVKVQEKPIDSKGNRRFEAGIGLPPNITFK